jgi:hypothetical protein
MGLWFCYHGWCLRVKRKSWGNGTDVNQNQRYEQGSDAGKKELWGPTSLLLLAPQVLGVVRSASDRAASWLLLA